MNDDNLQESPKLFKANFILTYIFVSRTSFATESVEALVLEWSGLDKGCVERFILYSSLQNGKSMTFYLKMDREKYLKFFTFIRAIGIEIIY